MKALALAAVLFLGPRVAPCATSDGWLVRDSKVHIQTLIACAVRRWPVPGGVRKALAVADCESDFRPWLRNPSGHIGVYQQAERYWLGRWRAWGKPLGVSRNPYDPLANVVVSIRQAHAAGWEAWSCA